MKKILVLAMLTCCGFINSIFAGDNIEEIESALKNNLFRRNIQNLKSSPNEVSYEAYGSDLGKTFRSGSIDLYFDLPSGLVGDLTLKINAYDVDYPSATEKDLVYFNDKEIGRLEGRNNTYVVDTFKVPASYIKSGQNKLRIDVNVSNEGWITAVSEAILTGSSFVLKASDGTDPTGIKLEWTDIGADTYEIWRKNVHPFDIGPYKMIAKVSLKNTYIDKDTFVGVAAPYQYYVKAGDKTSTEDTGFSGKKSVLPKVTKIETSKIWLQHSGGMKQVRITWNDFVWGCVIKKLKFFVEDKLFCEVENPVMKYNEATKNFITDLCLDNYSLDTHGYLKLTIEYDYEESNIFIENYLHEGIKSDKLTYVNVLYDKYGVQNDIPNWFRYWHDDKAIKNADEYIAVELLPIDQKKWECDNKFRFKRDDSGLVGEHYPYLHANKIDVNDFFPKVYINKREPSSLFVCTALASSNEDYSIPLNAQKKIESKFSGLEYFASTIKHEQKHRENHIDLFKKGCLVITGEKTDYTKKGFNNIDDFKEFLKKTTSIDENVKDEIIKYISDGNYVTDFDGDGLNDQEEEYKEKNGKYKDFRFETNNPDTWSFNEKNINFRSYATYGDNEVLARDAEKEGSEIINRENDWAFPGSKEAKEYEGYTKELWVAISNDVTKAYALFPSQTSNFTLKYHQNLKGEDSSSDVDRIFCYSTETDNLPEFVDIEDTGSVSIIGPATSVVLSNESGLFTNLVFNLTVTNSSDITEYRNITGWLVDSNGEPVAITKTGFTISQYKSITVPLKFDGNIIHRSNATGFTLKFVSLTEDTEFGPDIKQMLQDVASLEREYSYEEFAGDVLSIDKDGIGEIYSEEGLTFNIPFTSTIKDDLCKITLSLADTNGTYVASTTKEVSCVEGTNLVPVLFDAQTLYCSNISGPYKVQFVEVELSSGEKQRVWYAYISNEYSYKDFRSDSAVIDIDTSSVNIFAREAGSVSGYDAIVCNFNVSNSLDHAVSYTCEMILRNTNGTLVASSREVKRFEQGNNDISLYFSGDDIIESQIDGPYVVSEITLEPLDEIGIKERFLPEHEAIDLTISDFITRSFYLKSIPEYKGKLEESLSINVVVERPTEITATALLIDGFGEYVATATSTITAPSYGDYTLELAFDVAEIRASGHPGPYKISYLRLKSNIEGEKDLLVDEFEVSDIILWDYVLENGGAKICDGDSTLAMLNTTSGSLVIPSTIDGYPVTAIGDNAFSFFNNLTSVTIPDTVTSIGAEAFYGCSGITNLFIPNSVKSIGSRAFSSCSSLTTLIAGQYVCANRISNIFPDAYRTIKNIEILDGVTTIGNYAFQNCSSLTNITIPNSVTSIENYAFSDCGLTNATFLGNAPEAGTGIFSGCAGNFIIKVQEGTKGWNGDYTSTVIPKTWKGYPIYQPKYKYKVVFNANGGTGKMPAQTIFSDTSTNLQSNTFKRSGYVFAGWAKSKAGAVVYGNAALVNNLISGGTITLYAKWAKPKYKIAFYANGGTGSMSAQSMTYNKAAYLKKNAFKRSGYTFLGWAKTKTGAVVYKNAAAVKNLTASGATIKLYARWAKTKYKIAYYANGGKGSMATQSMTYNKAAYLTKNAFKRTGYVFAGWAKSATGSVVYTNGKAVKNLSASGATIKLYAKWKPITYKIVFNANGGSGSMAAQAMTYNRAAYLSKNAFKRSECMFLGWATTAKGAIAYKNAAAVKNLRSTAGTITLYARWAKTNYQIAFNANDGSGTMANQVMTYNKAAYLTKNAFKRTGYTFQGWAKSATGAVVYKNAAAVKNLSGSGATINLYAKWKPISYKIAFNANGGKGSMATKGMTYNKAAYLSKNAFKRSGYVFIGWAKSATGAVAYKNAAAVKNLRSTTGTITLYAKWAKTTYKVAFYANGGSGKMSAQAMTYNKAAYLKKNAFKRTGYAFKGWAKSPTGSVVYANGKAVKNLTTNGGTVKLYAVWKPTTYKIYFYANGGSGSMSAQAMTYNKAAYLTKNAFTRSGYTFKGWARSSTGSVVYADGQSVKNLTSTGATIYLYAIWKKVSSDLEFTTSGDASWFYHNSLTYNGKTVMQSGSITHNEETWLNTEFFGSGKISFYWKVSSESKYDTLEFYIDGVLQKTISGTGESWQYVEFNIFGVYTHTIRWCYAKDGSVSSGDDCGQVVDVRWSNFTTSGDASWFYDETLTYNGQTVMQSGSITHNEETWLNTKFSGSGKISFYWKVSSESKYDTLEFYIDGVLQKTISGTDESWQYVEFNISDTGTHTIRWCYAKDGSVSNGDDCGQICGISWIPAQQSVPQIGRLSAGGGQ